MRTLTEKLYDENVIFSYYGFIDLSVLTQVLKITKSKLESNNEPAAVVDRVYDALNNCIKNTMAHNFFPDDLFLRYKSLLVVSYNNAIYTVDTVNVVNQAQRSLLEGHLSYLNAAPAGEPERMRSEIVSRNQHMEVVETTGIGIVDLRQQADACNYSFQSYGPHFLFNINFTIHSVR